MENKYDFIREKVVKKKIEKKQVVKNFCFFCVQALAFGVLAAVAFAFIEPRMDRIINGEPNPVININVESSTVTDSNKTTEYEDTTTSEIGTVSVSNQNKLDDDRMLTKGVKDTILKSSVIVKSIFSGEDDSTEESTQLQTSGIVIHNGNTALVLTDYETVMESDSIEVVFYGEIEADATIYMVDVDLDLVVLRVETKDILPKNSEVQEAVFDMNTLFNGEDKYIYSGVSKGMGTLFAKCNIFDGNAIRRSGDNVIGVYATDIDENIGTNGFIYNNKAQLVGVITKTEKQNIPNLVTAFSVRDIKSRIEKMANGKKFPYVGISGITVDSIVNNEASEDIPKGVYVENVENNSPAYEAGVLKGDVLVELEGIKISSVEEYSNAINSLNVGNEIKIKVMRKGLEGYKEISYDIVVVSKP